MADPAAFLDALVACCRPGGDLFLSTLNRNWAGVLGGVLVAEYVLGLLPVGTHDYRKFWAPEALAIELGQRGCVLADAAGLGYAPGPRGGVAWRARADARSCANFVVHARKRG